MEENQDHNKHEPQVDLLLRLAKQYVEYDRYKEAKNLLDQAVQIDPLSATAHDYRGVILGLLDEDEAAMEAFSTALSVASSDVLAVVYYHRGLLCGWRGMYDLAIADLTQAVSREPAQRTYREALERAVSERDRRRGGNT